MGLDVPLGGDVSFQVHLAFLKPRELECAVYFFNLMVRVRSEILIPNLDEVPVRDMQFLSEIFLEHLVVEVHHGCLED